MILISGEFTYQVLVKCVACSKGALSRHRIRVQQKDVRELEKIIKRDFQKRIVDIPIGWISNGRFSDGTPHVICGDHMV